MSEPLYPYFRDLEGMSDQELRDAFDYAVTQVIRARPEPSSSAMSCDDGKPLTLNVS